MSKGTITEIKFNRKWDSPKGNTIFYFDVWFTDENKEVVTGQFSTIKQDQNKFLVGKEYDLTIEVKSPKSGGEYNFINKAQKDKNVSPVKGKAWKKDASVRRAMLAQSSIEHAITAVNNIITTWPELGIQDKITDTKQINKIAVNIMIWVTKYSGNNEQMEIICKSSIKRAVEVIPIKNLNIKSTDDILRKASEFKDHILANIERLIPLIPE